MSLVTSRLISWVAVVAVVTLLNISVATTAGLPSKGTVLSVTYSDTPPAKEVSALASLPIDEKEKLAWITWIWDDETRAHPGQTFRLSKDVKVTAVSILVASAENMGKQRFSIEFEGYRDVESDAAPAEEQLSLYTGSLPDDFDRQSPGKWVTFVLSRPIALERNRGYAFRFAFDQARDYDLRRAFIRATNVDAAGRPRSAVSGHMTHEVGDHRYAVWGSIEDMIFVLRTDSVN